MVILHTPCFPQLHGLNTLLPHNPPLQRRTHPRYSVSFPSPLSLLTLPTSSIRPQTSLFISNAKPNGTQNSKMGDDDAEEEQYVVYGENDEEDDNPAMRRFKSKAGEEADYYDRDPEFGEILGSCLEDPQKGQSRLEDRIKGKKDKILHTKTGSATPMKVTFNKFEFTNSYIWFEFYNAPLPNDVSLICDAIRSWHIVGRLGGCNSMNMQLSQSTFEKRPSYDAIQGANVTPTTFYNIGEFEMQDNLGRIWVDIGTSEPLLLDVLINALTQISSDYVGIKQLVFGGTEFENWKENLKSEDAGYSVHKIQVTKGELWWNTHRPFGKVESLNFQGLQLWPASAEASTVLSIENKAGKVHVVGGRVNVIWVWDHVEP